MKLKDPKLQEEFDFAVEFTAELFKAFGFRETYRLVPLHDSPCDFQLVVIDCSGDPHCMYIIGRAVAPGASQKPAVRRSMPRWDVTAQLDIPAFTGGRPEHYEPADVEEQLVKSVRTLCDAVEACMMDSVCRISKDIAESLFWARESAEEIARTMEKRGAHEGA